MKTSHDFSGIDHPVSVDVESTEELLYFILHVLQDTSVDTFKSHFYGLLNSLEMEFELIQTNRSISVSIKSFENVGQISILDAVNRKIHHAAHELFPINFAVSIIIEFLVQPLDRLALHFQPR